MNSPKPIACCVWLAAISGFQPAALAGELTPPAGAPAPTMKSLQEVEPRTPISDTTTLGDADSEFRITTPGSYYLTGDILVAAGKRGIEVATYGVTIDMNGFSITSLPNALEGIRSMFSSNMMTVRNGRFIGPETVAIRAEATATIEDVIVNGSSAITNGAFELYGPNSVVRRCTINEFRVTGIYCGNVNAVVEDCIVTTSVDGVEGSNWGIFLSGDRSVMRRCVIRVIPGVDAFQTGSAEGPVVVEDNIVEGGSLRFFMPGVIRNNSVSHATFRGIETSQSSGGGSVIEGNVLSFCNVGIAASSNVGWKDIVVGNRFIGCTTAITGSADVAPMGTAAASTNSNANIVN